MTGLFCMCHQVSFVWLPGEERAGEDDILAVANRINGVRRYLVTV